MESYEAWNLVEGPPLPLHCWPEGSLVAKLMHLEEVCFDPETPFVKASGMNRYRLLDPRGSLLMSLPIEGGRSHHQPLGRVRLVQPSPWASQHWKHLVNTYRRAPYFDYWADDLEKIILQPDSFLFDYNLRILDYLMTKLRHPLKIHIGSQNQPRGLLKKACPPLRPYYQHFEERLGFVPGLSVLDLVLQCGPNEAKAHLLERRTEP